MFQSFQRTKKKKKILRGFELNLLSNYPPKTNMMLPPLLPFSFFSPLLPSHSPLSFYFFYYLLFIIFKCFVGVLRPNQPLWYLCYASIHLSPCCVVHLLPSRCYCLLIVYLCVFILNLRFLPSRSAFMNEEE